MKVLIVGSGGREHVLAWKINKSPLVDDLYCAPGNGGISEYAKCVDIEPTDIQALLAFAKENKIDLTVVGPEAPLTSGIVDAFEKEKLKIFGPKKAAAQLEGSKIFAKHFMQNCNIPTPAFKTFEHPDIAKEHLKKADFPVVVKADGLASGKGVIICKDLKEAQEAVDLMMREKIFKKAGEKIIIEDCVKGEEVSILAVSDGNHFVILESSQDHKKIFDDDMGPNTGGMGAYSPAPVVNEALLKTIESRIIDPVIRGMRREGVPFKGVLYAGLMITVEGPLVLEFNVRFGDPEAQAVLPRMKNDLVELMLASCEGRIDQIKLNWDSKACVCVVMTSGGYPGEYQVGKEITGIDEALQQRDTFVFHAGTKRQEGKFLTTGGRVLGVTAMGKGIEESIERVYKAVEKIKFDRCFFRRDIGLKALTRIPASRRM